MLAKFILVRPVPPVFEFFEVQAVVLYPRMKKYMSNPKKLCAIQETSVLFSLTLPLQKSCTYQRISPVL